MSPYRHLTQQLLTVYPDGEARSIARWVMEERFSLSQTDLLLGKDSNLSTNERAELENITQRLLKNEPIQYILGQTTFCGLTLKVAPGVLIPRPETAELVDWITTDNSRCTIHNAQCTMHRSATTTDSYSQSVTAEQMPNAFKEQKNCELCIKHYELLDIGTGSGCIALALASRGFKVEACDISPEALAIAKANNERLGLDVHFFLKDILQTNDERRKTKDEKENENEDENSARYSVIVSNPPYICQKEQNDMDANVLEYEPHQALFVPDDDPLLFYRAIARYACRHLQPGGHLYFEINRAYGLQTAEMLKSLGFIDIILRSDSFGNDRMIRAKK